VEQYFLCIHKNLVNPKTQTMPQGRNRRFLWMTNC
jgi:hypothetical protein